MPFTRLPPQGWLFHLLRWFASSASFWRDCFLMFWRFWQAFAFCHSRTSFCQLHLAIELALHIFLSDVTVGFMPLAIRRVCSHRRMRNKCRCFLYWLSSILRESIEMILARRNSLNLNLVLPSRYVISAWICQVQMHFPHSIARFEMSPTAFRNRKVEMPSSLPCSFRRSEAVKSRRALRPRLSQQRCRHFRSTLLVRFGRAFHVLPLYAAADDVIYWADVFVTREMLAGR